MKKIIITAVLMGILLMGCQSDKGKQQGDGYVPWWAKQEKAK